MSSNHSEKDVVNYPIHSIPHATLKEIPNNQLSSIPSNKLIFKKKYSTSIDKRNFLTVYEFLVNNHWIIWDYVTGYVHLTGLWKAIGNSKADIVKLIDNAPELVNLIKRIRGGYLKIQGTWLPFKYAKILAVKFCFNIRYCLIPIFGEDFPSECLKPTDVGFGELKLFTNDKKISKKKMKKKSLSNISSIDDLDLKNISTNEFNELIDLLNASKSLQLLSNKNSSDNYFNLNNNLYEFNNSNIIKIDNNMNNFNNYNTGYNNNYTNNYNSNYTNSYSNNYTDGKWENALESDDETLINSSLTESPTQSKSKKNSFNSFSSLQSINSLGSINLTRKNSLNNILNIEPEVEQREAVNNNDSAMKQKMNINQLLS